MRINNWETYKLSEIVNLVSDGFGSRTTGKYKKQLNSITIVIYKNEEQEHQPVTSAIAKKVKPQKDE